MAFFEDYGLYCSVGFWQWFMTLELTDFSNFSIAYFEIWYNTKNTFIVPIDAHNYKIIEMLKQFKIIIAPTCFGSRRNHHQVPVLCLAKTSKWFSCVRQYRRSQCYGGISACCAGLRWKSTPSLHWLRLYRRAQKTHFVVLAKHKTGTWWWFLREPKHVGAIIIIFILF
jgi:hypothetical protein